MVGMAELTQAQEYKMSPNGPIESEIQAKIVLSWKTDGQRALYCEVAVPLHVNVWSSDYCHSTYKIMLEYRYTRSTITSSLSTMFLDLRCLVLTDK